MGTLESYQIATPYVDLGHPEKMQDVSPAFSDMSVQGIYAYVTGAPTQEPLVVYDISTAENPVRVGSLDPSVMTAFLEIPTISRIKVQNSVAFLSDPSQDMFIAIDISDPRNPILMSPEALTQTMFPDLNMRGETHLEADAGPWRYRFLNIPTPTVQSWDIRNASTPALLFERATNETYLDLEIIPGMLLGLSPTAGIVMHPLTRE